MNISITKPIFWDSLPENIKLELTSNYDLLLLYIATYAGQVTKEEELEIENIL